MSDSRRARSAASRSRARRSRGQRVATRTCGGRVAASRAVARRTSPRRAGSSSTAHCPRNSRQPVHRRGYRRSVRRLQDVAQLRPAKRLRRRRQTGPGDPGASRGLDHDDRRDAAQTRRRPNRQSVPRGRARQRSDFGDPARLLPAAHRASGGLGGQGARRSREPSRQGGHPRGRAARRHHRRQDQRHHTRHLHHDRQRQLRRAERGQALRRGGRFAHSGRKDPAGFTFRAVLGRRVGHGDG